MTNDELVERKAEPVAWRCKDYADGWILYDSELRARDYKVKTGCLMQPLYSTPPAAPVDRKAEPVGYVSKYGLDEVAEGRMAHIAPAGTFRPENEIPLFSTPPAAPVQPEYGYMRIVEVFDRNETAGAFLSEDGEGGFAAGVSRMADEIDRLRAALSASTPPAAPVKVTEGSDPLAELVSRFSAALLEKLKAAEAKYGYSDDWMKNDWRDELAAKLIKHVHKGDPRDVAAYCAFAWHHGWSITPASDKEAK